MFRVPEGPIVRRTITFLSRDISDPITPQPFLFVLRDRLLPLSEGTKYDFEIELRSPYPSPTLAPLVLATTTGQIGRAHVCIHVTNAPIVCSLILVQTKTTYNTHAVNQLHYTKQ